MRQIAIVVVVALVAVTAFAQAPPVEKQPLPEPPAGVENLMFHGEFAVLLLKLVWTQGELPSPAEALEQVKELGLVPNDWKLYGFLTEGELSDVLDRFGISYIPAGRDEYPTRRQVEALLRRELAKLRDYLARRMGHGFSTSHVIDEGVDRAVSPDDFP